LFLLVPPVNLSPIDGGANKHVFVVALQDTEKPWQQGWQAHKIKPLAAEARDDARFRFDGMASF
jgi:hypothetical protein